MAKDANGLSTLDANQVIRKSSVDLSGGGISTGTIVMNSLVPDEYEQIQLTYVAAGDGVGEIETVVFKLNAVSVATLTLSYDASNRLIDVVRS
jgi:hypothetical protein